MAKQREAMGLDNRGKWRLLSGMTDILIPHEIRPFEAKDSLQTPLVIYTLIAQNQIIIFQQHAIYYLTFDGLALTVDHGVWSNNAVWSWISLNYLELHSTHTSTYQIDIALVYWPICLQEVRLQVNLK